MPPPGLNRYPQMLGLVGLRVILNAQRNILLFMFRKMTVTVITMEVCDTSNPSLHKFSVVK